MSLSIADRKLRTNKLRGTGLAIFGIAAAILFVAGSMIWMP